MKKLEAWKIISSEMVFDHKWYKLRKDVVEIGGGNVIDDYFVSVRPEVVIVFPVTREGQVLMVRQYKHGAQQILLEFPGGVIDGGEEIEEAAKRELIEETGYKVGKLIFLNSLVDNPTKDTNKIHLFLGLDAVQVGEQNLDNTENIQVIKVPLNEIKVKLRNGEISVAGSVALAFLSLDKLDELSDKNEKGA
jgi:ADP-ribose pyrophosphatase